MDWVEAYPGQKFSLENPEVKFGHDMPVEFREKAKAKLADAGLNW